MPFSLDICLLDTSKGPPQNRPRCIVLVRPGHPFGCIFEAFENGWFSTPFWDHLASILPPNLTSQTHKNQSKIDAQIPSLVASIFWSIFDRFLLPTSPPKPQKSLKFDRFYKVFCKMGLSKLTSIFDAILVPTCLHFASQNPSKPLQKPTPRGIKKLIDFCFDFCSIFAPFWKPSWTIREACWPPKISLRRSKSRPGRPEEAEGAQTPLRLPKWPQNDPPDLPKWPSRPSKMTLQTPQKWIHALSNFL